MSNSEHPAVATTPRAFRCTFGPVRDVELVWPPADEDLDAFTVVPLVDESAAPPRLKPTFGDCRARGTAPRVRPLVVPMEPLQPLAAPGQKDDAPAIDEPPPIPVGAHVVELAPAPGDNPAVVTTAGPAPLSLLSVDRLRDLEPSLAGQSASLAVLVAAACLVVAVVQYQAISFVTNEASASASSVEPPPLPLQLTMADLAPGVSLDKAAPRTTPTRRPAPPATPVAASASAAPSASPARSRPAPPARPVADRPSPVPAPAASTQQLVLPATRTPVVARDVGAASSAAPPRVASAAAPTLVARAEPGAAPVPTPATLPPPAPVSASASATEPLAAVAVPVRPVAAVLTSASTDEADIRSTLTRFRTAYSQLDAGAARDVWPSVDRRALERAFQSLKSQELRFDQCSLTVTGARAQAACKGRAIYVPRIGDQSPRFSSREWTFELQKAAERWTIASARSL
jgi:hypothetical protein